MSDGDPITPFPDGVPQVAVTFEFVRSRGSGGQNVNKVATGVLLRLNVGTTTLSATVKSRLLKLAGARATKAGQVIIKADRHRTQARNRADAIERLGQLVTKAKYVRKSRRPTKVKTSAKKRRLDQKGRRGTIKKLRGSPPPD